MAQNVTIAGASYLGVPSIEMPKTGGGTAVFVDTSDANAAAGDITKGKTAYVGGTKITGTLEASSVSVQDTKALTITSNGTVSVTPDAPYDALKKVDVTVDVSGGGETAENVVITSTLSSDLKGFLQICGIDKDGNKILLNGYTTPVSVKKNTPLMIRVAEYPYARISGQFTVIGTYSASQNIMLDIPNIASGVAMVTLIVPTGDLTIYGVD